MATYSSKSFAGRLGYGLGRGVHFLLVDENLVLRWIKRTALAALLIIFIAYAANVIMIAAITVGLLFLGVSLLAKLGDSGLPDDYENSQPSESKILWGTNGSDGQWHGEELDNDPHSQANIHNSLFHESDFNMNEKD